MSLYSATDDIAVAPQLRPRGSRMQSRPLAGLTQAVITTGPIAKRSDQPRRKRLPACSRLGLEYPLRTVNLGTIAPEDVAALPRRASTKLAVPVVAFLWPPGTRSSVALGPGRMPAGCRKMTSSQPRRAQARPVARRGRLDGHGHWKSCRSGFAAKSRPRKCNVAKRSFHAYKPEIWQRTHVCMKASDLRPPNPRPTMVAQLLTATQVIPSALMAMCRNDGTRKVSVGNPAESGRASAKGGALRQHLVAKPAGPRLVTKNTRR